MTPRLRSWLGRLRRWPRAQRPTHPPSWQTVSNGPLRGLEFRLPVDPRPTGWVANMLRGEYEPLLLQHLQDLAQERDVLYDIGGHVGFVACAWLHFGGRRVEIFEPSPGNARCIQGALERNGFQASARVHRLAVGASSGEATLISHDDDIGIASMSHLDGHGVPKMKRQKATTRFTVPVRSLDDWARDAEAGSPEVVKIDVEGAETDVVRGARGILREVRPVTFCELHGVRQAVETTAELVEIGYRATNLDAAAGMPLVRFDPR